MQVMTQGRKESTVQSGSAIPRPEILTTTLGDLGEARELALPHREVLGVTPAREAGMVERDDDVREGRGQRLDAGVRLGRRVEAGHQVVPLEVGKARAPPRVARVVAFSEVPHAAEVREGKVPIDDVARVIPRQVDLADDAVGMTQSVRERLEPTRLLHRVIDAQRGLDVDRLAESGEARLTDEVIGPVALRLDGADVSHDRVHELRLQPRVPQARIAQVVEVDVGVDEREPGHCSPPCGVVVCGW